MKSREEKETLVFFLNLKIKFLKNTEHNPNTNEKIICNLNQSKKKNQKYYVTKINRNEWQYIVSQMYVLLHFYIWLKEYQSKFPCFDIIQPFTSYFTHSGIISARSCNFQQVQYKH